MRSTRPQTALPFGYIADVLFQITINGEANTVLTLCLLNRATYHTIKVLEPHICRWFMRLRGIDAFNPISSLDSATGQQSALTVHTLVRSLYRHDLARRLSLQIVPAVWGPLYEDDKVEMNYEAELKLSRRLERGLHVLFHMADIARDIKREPHELQKISPSPSVVPKRVTVLAKFFEEYDYFNSEFNFDFPLNKARTKNKHKNRQTLLLAQFTSTPSFSLDIEHAHTKHHLATVLKRGHAEFEIGKRRLEFRSKHLTDTLEVDFHCTLRMLRELLERMLLRHGPKFWHRDTRNEYSVVSWFLLNQTPRNLAKLLLTPQDECCQYNHHVDALDKSTSTSANARARNCLFSDPLDEYWDAWNDIPDVPCPSIGTLICTLPNTAKSSATGTRTGTRTGTGSGPGTSCHCNCNCNRLIRSWSVKPALFDNRGREFNRAAERYLKEMWSQRHVGLHQAFTMGVFATVL
ncbi:hypothetical protein BDW75DRAFT_176414 [Aspergillus navahoensis]